MAAMACTAQAWGSAGGKANPALAAIDGPVGRESRDLRSPSWSRVVVMRERERLWRKSACAGAMMMPAEGRVLWWKSTRDGGKAARAMGQTQRRRLWRKSAHNGRCVEKIRTAAEAAPLCAAVAGAGGSAPRSRSPPIPPYRSLDSIVAPSRDSRIDVAIPRPRLAAMLSSTSFRVRRLVEPSTRVRPIPTVRSSTWRLLNERGKRRQGAVRGKGKGKGNNGGGGSPSPTCALGWDSILLAGLSLMIEGRRRRRAPLLLSSSTSADDISNARQVESHAHATSSSSSSSPTPGNQSNDELLQEQHKKIDDRREGKEEEEEGGEEEKEKEKDQRNAAHHQEQQTSSSSSSSSSSSLSPSPFSSVSSSSSSSSSLSSTADVDYIQTGSSTPNPVSDGQLQRLMMTLSKDFPEVYLRELDWSIYSEDVIFVDPVVSLKGLLQHQGMYIVLRAMAWAWFDSGSAVFEIQEITEVHPHAKTRSPFSHREYTDTLHPKRAVGMTWRTRGKTRWGTIADFSGDDVFRVAANGLIISHESSWNEDPAAVWREVFLGEQRSR